MDKFDTLLQQQVLGSQARISTDAVVSKLRQWDSSYGVEVQEVERHRLTIRFLNLPGNTRRLAEDIYALCPAVIDEHFGRMDQMVEIMQESGEALDDEVARLIRGVDFSKRNFGFELLQRWLRNTHAVDLWWE